MSTSPFPPPDTTYADIGLLKAEAESLRKRAAALAATATARNDGSDVDVECLAAFLSTAVQSADQLVYQLDAAQGRARYPIPQRTLGAKP